jgi:hypothetical protein
MNVAEDTHQARTPETDRAICARWIKPDIEQLTIVSGERIVKDRVFIVESTKGRVRTIST